MAVAFDAKFAAASGGDSDTVEASGATSVSTTKLTIGASATLLIVAACWSTKVTARSCTWNSVTVPEILTSFDTSGNNLTTSYFLLPNPDTGNHTLALSWTTSADLYLGALSLTGTDTATGYNSADNVTDTTSATTCTVTSAANDMTVAIRNANGNQPTMNFNEFFHDNPLAHGAGGSYQAGGSSNGHTFTGMGGSVWTMLGIHILAASGGTSASITGVTATATAAGIAGSVTALRIISVTGVSATAPADGVAGAVTAIQIVSITGITATASASGIAGSVNAVQGPFAEITGTATASIVESDIVTGGKTIIITLTNTTWIEA